jgi:hypothetical protein
MTDEELIARLRDVYVDNTIRLTAADRLDELLSDLKAVLAREAETQARHDNKLDALEAKLAKAVSALQELVICVDDGCYCSEQNMASAVDEAHAALAEIKGEKK